MQETGWDSGGGGVDLDLPTVVNLCGSYGVFYSRNKLYAIFIPEYETNPPHIAFFSAYLVLFIEAMIVLLKSSSMHCDGLFLCCNHHALRRFWGGGGGGGVAYFENSSAGALGI